MGLLDDYSKGVGSPRPAYPHQFVMAHALRRMIDEIEEQGLRLATEITVTQDLNDLAPDIVIFDKDYYFLSSFEITKHSELKAIMCKCYELIDRFPLAEYFVFDYEQHIMYMYDEQNDRWLSSIKYDLCSAFLEKPVINYFIKTL